MAPWASSAVRLFCSRPATYVTVGVMMPPPGNWLVRVAAVAPVILLVAVAGVLGLLGLLCGEKRRDYVITLSEKALNAAISLLTVRGPLPYPARRVGLNPVPCA